MEYLEIWKIWKFLLVLLTPLSGPTANINDTAMVVDAAQESEAVEVLDEDAIIPTVLSPQERLLEGVLFVGHIYLVGDVPYEFGWYAFDAANEFGIDPYDLATLLITENSGPDMDLSVEASFGRRYQFDYDPATLGKHGEVGLWQIKAKMWPRKAGKKLNGVPWTAEDLKDPEINARVAAFVVWSNHRSHRACEKRKYNYHDWPSHFKCVRSERDIVDPHNRCRWAAMKFEKSRKSIGMLFSPNIKAIGKAHLKRYKKVVKRAERDYRRKHRRAIRKARREAAAHERAGEVASGL